MLPNGEFARRRSSKSLPTIVSLVLASIRSCGSRGSTLEGISFVTVGSESISIGSNGAIVFSVEALLTSTSYHFATSLSDPDNERLDKGGREGLSQNPRLVVPVPSMEESNEVCKDLAEKEVFGDVQADEALVMEDETDIVWSKEPKGLSDPDSEVLFCAGCLG